MSRQSLHLTLEGSVSLLRSSGLVVYLYSLQVATVEQAPMTLQTV